jgi:hypothetical protein
MIAGMEHVCSNVIDDCKIRNVHADTRYSHRDDGGGYVSNHYVNLFASLGGRSVLFSKTVSIP